MILTNARIFVGLWLERTNAHRCLPKPYTEQLPQMLQAILSSHQHDVRHSFYGGTRLLVACVASSNTLPSCLFSLHHDGPCSIVLGRTSAYLFTFVCIGARERTSRFALAFEPFIERVPAGEQAALSTDLNDVLYFHIGAHDRIRLHCYWGARAHISVTISDMMLIGRHGLHRVLVFLVFACTCSVALYSTALAQTCSFYLYWGARAHTVVLFVLFVLGRTSAIVCIDSCVCYRADIFWCLIKHSPADEAQLVMSS